MKKIICLSFLIALFASCEQVIDVPLKDADERLVVEAIVTNDSDLCYVKLSKVSNFYSSNSFNAVSNAVVKVIENGTVEYSMLLVAPGIYKATSLIGLPGSTYQLNISVNGEQYSAISKMPAPVSIDSLTLKDEFFFGDTSKVLTCHFQDPLNVSNNYRYKTLFTDSIGKGISIDRDQFFNGEYIDRDLFSVSGDFEKSLGDTVTVELWSIDAAVYDYFFTLAATLNSASGQFATPANPNTNVSNGALGYFSAHAISRRGIKLIP
jgi:hypothetical protein